MNKNEEFDIKQPLTQESFQKLLDLYFPDRRKNMEWTRVLYEELKANEIELMEILDCYMRVRDFLPELEQEDIERINRPPIHDRVPYEGLEKGEDWKGWAQVGIVRVVLDLSNNKYWNDKLGDHAPPEQHIEKITKWRKIIYENEK